MIQRDLSEQNYKQFQLCLFDICLPILFHYLRDNSMNLFYVISDFGKTLNSLFPVISSAPRKLAKLILNKVAEIKVCEKLQHVV